MFSPFSFANAAGGSSVSASEGLDPTPAKAERPETDREDTGHGRLEVTARPRLGEVAVLGVASGEDVAPRISPDLGGQPASPRSSADEDHEGISRLVRRVASRVIPEREHFEVVVSAAVTTGAVLSMRVW